MNVSVGWAHRLVAKELDRLRSENREAAEQLRELQNERYDEIILRLWSMAMPVPSPEDVAAKRMPPCDLDAMKRLLEALKSLERINGVEAPTQSQIGFAVLQRGGAKMAALIMEFVPADHLDAFAARMEQMMTDAETELETWEDG